MILIIICVILLILLVPVKSAIRWTTPVLPLQESFLTAEIENPPNHLIMGSQSEMERAHASDIYSRLANVRIDPYGI
jgi:hypothetical protein